MRRLPKVLTAVTLGGCSAPAPSGFDAGYDASLPDAGGRDAGRPDGGKTGTPWGDAGCVLPTDFPWDSGFSETLAWSACQCTWAPTLFHCFEENGPRCFSWACPPAKERDGGYEYTADGGLICLC